MQILDENHMPIKIKLDNNENPLGASPKAIDSIKHAIKRINRYPEDGCYELKSKLSNKFNINSDEIILGNGSYEIIQMLAKAFIQNGDNVITPRYSFMAYKNISEQVGAKVTEIELINWQHDLEGIVNSISNKTKLIFIANPDNPTSCWTNSLKLRDFIEKVPNNIIIVIDEAYAEYIKNVEYPNTINWIKLYPNIMVIRTFSKAYGLAGLRVGYGIASKNIINTLNKKRLKFNVNFIGLIASIASLEDDSHINNTIKINNEGIKQLTNGFNDLNLSFFPPIGNFITVNFGKNAQIFHKKLIATGIITKSLNEYNLHDYLRITIGLPSDNKLLLNTIEKLLRELLIEPQIPSIYFD